ncbi:uncharacterized protein M6B38_156220 [Iris pallida]|uniref:peptidylprolyl isomerase n=1 Tax=Iris pallida TaxID=29817 RepID=A0AAX6F457_IRIPA|nr:uncharacterized protein M6B38_156220 [Iris pallida]
MTFCPKLPFQRHQPLLPQVLVWRHANIVGSLAVHNAVEGPSRRLLMTCRRNFRHSPWPISAVSSGLEATISDQKKKEITLDNAKIVVESRDDNKINVRVDLTGEETQKAFDEVLTNLARTAPPIPGFRKMKGGKTSNVPKSFLLQMLGKDRVTKFLIQEIVSATIGDYVKKEDLTVKSQFQTAQTFEELESAFTPGSEFGFNATVEIINPDSETIESDSS